jgi:hypothetical protein
MDIKNVTGKAVSVNFSEDGGQTISETKPIGDIQFDNPELDAANEQIKAIVALIPETDSCYGAVQALVNPLAAGGIAVGQ